VATKGHLRRRGGGGGTGAKTKNAGITKKRDVKKTGILRKRFKLINRGGVSAIDWGKGFGGGGEG